MQCHHSTLSSPFHLAKDPFLKAVFSLFLLVESSSEISELIEAKTRYFCLPVSILVGNVNEI